MFAAAIAAPSARAADSHPCDVLATRLADFAANDSERGAEQSPGEFLDRSGLLSAGSDDESFDEAYAALSGLTVDATARQFMFESRYLDGQGDVTVFDHRKDGGFVAFTQVAGSLGCTRVAAFLIENGTAKPGTGSPEDDCGIFEDSYFAVTKLDNVAYPAVAEIRRGGGHDYIDTIALFKLPIADFSAEHAACEVDLAFDNTPSVQEWLRVEGEDAALQDKVISALKGRIIDLARREAASLGDLQLPEPVDSKLAAFAAELKRYGTGPYESPELKDQSLRDIPAAASCQRCDDGYSDLFAAEERMMLSIAGQPFLLIYGTITRGMHVGPNPGFGLFHWDGVAFRPFLGGYIANVGHISEIKVQHQK